MTRFITTFALSASLALSGCGATRRATTATGTIEPTLTSAAATFITQQNGKDRNSAVTVQLLRRNSELAAELRHTGTKFDDHTTSAPLALTLSAPFHTADVDTGQVRVRLMPDGQDDWNFDLRLALQFSDGTARNFIWNNVALNNAAPERVLVLSGARVP